MKRVIFVMLVLFHLPGCAAVLVGGMIYSANKSKELCAEFMADENFESKMKLPESQEYYQKICKPKDKEDKK